VVETVPETHMINQLCLLLLGKIQNVPLIWYWK